MTKIHQIESNSVTKTNIENWLSMQTYVVSNYFNFVRTWTGAISENSFVEKNIWFTYTAVGSLAVELSKLKNVRFRLLSRSVANWTVFGNPP